MTGLQILNALKADRANAVLWINHDRREAAFHPGGAHVYAMPVAYNDAMIARTDPALNIIDRTDGETMSA
jgi:ABC-type tungstate transport system permease subunit